MAKKKQEDKKAQAAEFVKSVLAEISEDQRETVKEALENDKVLGLIGDGVLRQSEFSRGMDELTTRNTEVEAQLAKSDTIFKDNVQWRADNEQGVAVLKAENERLKKALAVGDGVGDPDPEGDPSPPGFDSSRFVSKEDFDKAVNDRIAGVERDGVKLMSVMTRLTTQHLKEFDEVLDTDALIAHANEKKLHIDTAYDDFIKDRVEEKRQKEFDEKIEAAKKEARVEAFKEANAVPYLVDSSEPSTLDGLKKSGKEEYGSKAALDEYYRNQHPGAS